MRHSDGFFLGENESTGSHDKRYVDMRICGREKKRIWGGRKRVDQGRDEEGEEGRKEKGQAGS